MCDEPDYQGDSLADISEKRDEFLAEILNVQVSFSMELEEYFIEGIERGANSVSHMLPNAIKELRMLHAEDNFFASENFTDDELHDLLYDACRKCFIKFRND